MSEQCEKCGADISFQSEYHPNCDAVVRLKDAIRSMLLAGTNQAERIAIHHAKKLLAELEVKP